MIGIWSRLYDASKQPPLKRFVARAFIVKRCCIPPRVQSKLGDDKFRRAANRLKEEGYNNNGKGSKWKAEFKISRRQFERARK